MAEEKTVSPRDVATTLFSELCEGRSSRAKSELSDTAAILVGTGLLDPATTAIILRRVHRRAPLPTVGGFAELRVLAEERYYCKVAGTSATNRTLRYFASARAVDIDRRVSGLRRSFVRGSGTFASRVRDIRRERKEGIHLDPAQRDALFDALLSTPTLAPIKIAPTTALEATVSAMKRGHNELGRVSLPANFSEIVPAHLRDAIDNFAAGKAVARGFPEMYTAVLFTIGQIYDQITALLVSGTEASEQLRMQFDTESEVASIAGELCELRRCAIERSVALPGFHESTGLGGEFDLAWQEIIDRVAALLDLTETAAKAVESEKAQLERIGRPVARPTSAFDPIAERLVSGSGHRQVSTEAMHRLRQQLDDNN